MPLQERSRSPFELSRREVLQRSLLGVGALAALPVLGRVPKHAVPRAGIDADARDVPLSGERASNLERFVRDRMRAAHLPGLSALVSTGLDVTWSRGFGWADIEADVHADADTVSMLASISKTVICAAIMQLWEQGSIDLDADVNSYLSFPVRNPNHPDKKITARMLLTHTSSIADRYSLWGSMANPTPQGYSHGDATITLHDILAGYLVPAGPYYVASKNFYDLMPGERYHYSNIGADVAALLVEEISGTPFDQYCKDNIFTPLGMTQTGHHLVDITTPNLMMPYKYHLAEGTYSPYYQYGYPDYPCGTLRTSAPMLSRWMRCFMNHGELEGTRILKRSTVAEIRRPQISGVWWQGLIFYYRSNHGTPLIGHSGSDYGVHTSMFFEANASRPRGVIVLSNRYVYGWKAWYAAQDIEARLFLVS